MARKLRVEYPGAIYHVINRGDRQEPIFKSDEDRNLFLTCLDQCCSKTGWQVHAYVLMPNHFHLVLETPQPNLVAGMKWFLGTYTNRFNRRHKLFGHLFSGRYKSLLVDGLGNGYLKTVCDYVHLNPARAKLVGPRTALSKFPWSSWPEYLKAPSKRPSWLRVDRLLGEHGVPKDSLAGRRNLESRVEARRSGEQSEDYQPIRRGWCLGDTAFREELLDQMEGRMGTEHYGAERTESDEIKAERVIAEELKKRRWKEKDLTERLKGDPEKVKIALRLRRETVRSVEWIAKRLYLGSRNYANHLLWKAGRQGLQESV
jgi:putative transposase